MEKLNESNEMILGPIEGVLLVGKEVNIDTSSLQKYINEMKEMKMCYEVENPIRKSEELFV